MIWREIDSVGKEVSVFSGFFFFLVIVLLLISKIVIVDLIFGLALITQKLSHKISFNYLIASSMIILIFN